MTQKKWWSFAGVGVLLLFVAITYWFYFSKPAPFPTNELLIEEMSIFFPEVAGSVIQDTVPLDQHHVYVPFILEDNNGGLSFWEWKHHKWKPVYVSTNGDLRIWKINRKDPSTFHLVWNFSAIDQPDYMKLYLIKKEDIMLVGMFTITILGYKWRKNLRFRRILMAVCKFQLNGFPS